LPRVALPDRSPPRPSPWRTGRITPWASIRAALEWERRSLRRKATSSPRSNRQGPDVGDQYRSEVFTFSDTQIAAARTALADAEKRVGKRVVTRISPVGAFYKAEPYHQQYDEKTGTHSCPIGLPKST
jgi:hypothetical protein